MQSDTLFVGIDVQVRRGLAYCLLDHQGVMQGAGWAKGKSRTATVNELKGHLLSLNGDRRLAIGIDAPRTPLPSQRGWNWDGAQRKWRQRRPSEKGLGRHCEVVLKSLNIANPQWTPCMSSSPEWMLLGYSLFRDLAEIGNVYEVFPSASYACLQGCATPTITLNFANVSPGPKDMLDACVAALTVREFLEGRGWEAGGGDGLGTIILPGKVSDQSPVMIWPEQRL